MARWQPAERDARYRRALNFGLPPAVTEGDSWFDYPMYENLVDRIDDRHRFAFKRFEKTGDTVHNMLGTPALGFAGVDSLRVVVEHERPQFILFSGGGNDVLAKGTTETLFDLFDPAAPGKPAADYFNANWTALMRRLQDAYERMIAVLGPIAPIFAHGYDFMIPSHKPVRFDGIAITGPWLITALEKNGIVDGTLQRDIGQELVLRFNAMLDALEADHIPLFAHIDLTGTLAGDTDWENEIHPTEKGFVKLAAAFLGELDRKLEPILANRESLGLTVVR